MTISMPLYSPPLKPRRSWAHGSHERPYHPQPRSWFFRRSRWIYATVILVLFWLWRPRAILPRRAPVHAPSIRYKSIDWSRYAYSQYATNSAYLCNAAMVFDSLSRLGSKADRILFYPETWDLDIADPTDRDSQLLVKARDAYSVQLIPVEISDMDKNTWNSSFTKFLNWDQTQYDRILHLDSDVTVMQHLDELFLLPPAPVAMLRAYWKLPEKVLTSFFILLEPSQTEYTRLMAAARASDRPRSEYDMEILNRFYGDSAMVLPHKRYGLLSGELRSDGHENFLGNDYDSWDADQALKAASLVHFSDWPLPKPWIMWPHNLLGETMPKCKGMETGETDCRDKKVWLGLYDSFRRRRKVCCFSVGFCEALADYSLFRTSAHCCRNRLQNGHPKSSMRRFLLDDTAVNAHWSYEPSSRLAGV